MDNNGKWTTRLVWLIVTVMFVVLVYSLTAGNLRPTQEDLLVQLGWSETSPDGT